MKSISRKEKDAPKLAENNLEHGVDELQEEPNLPEADPEAMALAPKIEISKGEGQLFEPLFDPYFDGDKGNIDDAMEYLAHKAVSSSNERAASTNALQDASPKDGTTERDEAPSHNEPRPKASRSVRGMTEARAAEDAQLSPSERLRVKMWQARARNSKATGLVLLILSAAFLAIAFLAASSSFEIMAIISFIFGVFLTSSGLEANVKLIPSADSVRGPTLSLADELAKRGFIGNAQYVPEKDGETTMEIGKEQAGGETETLVPIGRGLVASYERELGPLKEAEMDYVRTWVPRVMVKGLGLAEVVKIDVVEGTAKMTMRRSVMRPNCVNADFNARVCEHIGCPLVSSIGEVLALSTGKEVTFLGCEYDPLKETSSAKFSIKQE